MKKKLHLIALLCLVILSSCSKNDVTGNSKKNNSDNVMVQMLNFMDEMIGMDTIRLDEYLEENGYHFDGYEGDKCTIKFYTNDSKSIEFHIGVGGIDNVRGVAVYLSSDKIPSLNQIETHRSFYKYLGNSYKPKTGEVLNFAGCGHRMPPYREEWAIFLPEYDEFMENLETIWGEWDEIIVLYGDIEDFDDWYHNRQKKSLLYVESDIDEVAISLYHAE